MSLTPPMRIPPVTRLGLTQTGDRSLLGLRPAMPVRRRTRFHRAWLPAVLVTLLCSGIGGYAQTYLVDWFTIAGGAGTSTGGTFAVRTTIGQPTANASALTGGNFSVVGGFWSIFAVQTPGAPRLTVSLNLQFPGVIVSWPSSSTGYVLQEIADLNQSNWGAVRQPVSDNGTNKCIVVSSPPGEKRFYRLVKP